MAVNSESIYGTTASPFGRPEWGRCTAKGNKRYLHVFQWPADGQLDVPLAGASVEQGLSAGRQESEAGGDSRARIKSRSRCPQQAPDAIDSVVVLVLKNQ